MPKPAVDSRKMILCLPFAPHEVAQARELVRLWVDLEPSYNEDVALAIVSRFDIQPHHIGQDIIDYARTKFKVLLHRCKREGTGWPRGCNQLEVGAYEWFVESNRSNDFDIPYIFFAEADTVPLRPTWLSEIVKEAYDNKSLMLGAYFVQEDGWAHINGNAVIHRDFWKVCKAIWRVRPHTGWDVAIGKEALKFGTPSRLIWQDYRLGAPDNPWKGNDYIFAPKSFNTPQNPLFGEVLQPAFLHGCKTLQAQKAVRERFLKKNA